MQEQRLLYPLGVITHLPLARGDVDGDHSVAACEGPESGAHLVANHPLAAVFRLPIQYLRVLVLVRWMLILVSIATFIAAVDLTLIVTAHHHNPVDTDRSSFGTREGEATEVSFEDSANIAQRS